MSNQFLMLEQYVTCPDCDLLMQRSAQSDNQSKVCPRCGKTLSKPTEDSITKVLALSFSGLLLYLPAMLLPLMSLESLGFSDSANILESIVIFYQNEYQLVATMVLLSAMVFPLVLLGCIFLVSLNLYLQRYPRYLARLLRYYLHLHEWAMVEVYLLGIMITLIKMVDTSEVHFHSGMVCFTFLVLLSLAITTVLDKELFWSLIEKNRSKNLTNRIPAFLGSTDRETGADCGIIHCHTCHKLSPLDLEGSDCPRCGEVLHLRKTNSISMTWALVLTSAIFMFPANMLPIMQVDFLGIPDRSTIMDGIIYFFKDGSYFIGLIIFTASILVPIFKVVGLVILLFATRPTNIRFLRPKAKMYRVISFIGRWSMLDVFVIALLTAVVDFGFFTSIHAAPAATYFCIVVICTMFAAITFDPRIIWDKCNLSKQPSLDNRQLTQNQS